MSLANENDDQDEMVAKSLQYKTELIWCQNYIQKELEITKNEKKKESLMKACNILKNPKTSLPQKRAVMSQHCQDYRKKMNDEIVKSKSQGVIVKMKPVPVQSKEVVKSVFIKKKSIIPKQSSEVSSREFKFNLP